MNFLNNNIGVNMHLPGFSTQISSIFLFHVPDNVQNISKEFAANPLWQVTLHFSPMRPLHRENIFPFFSSNGHDISGVEYTIYCILHHINSYETQLVEFNNIIYA